jgi:hypothetical protein
MSGGTAEQATTGAAPLTPTRDANGDGSVSLNEFATSYREPSNSATSAAPGSSEPLAQPAERAMAMDTNERLRQNFSRQMESYGGPARNGDAATFSSFAVTA